MKPFILQTEIARANADYFMTEREYAVEHIRNGNRTIHRAYEGEPNFKTLDEAEKRRGMLSIGGQARVVTLERV